MEKQYFKAFIRVVKSLSGADNGFQFGDTDVVDDRMIEAESKEKVKQILLERYPQFFPNNKVYERETKDQSQFFYCVIFPLYNRELVLIEEGQWICDQCGEIHENKYISRPYHSERTFPGKIFCNFEDCFDRYKKEYFKDIDLTDDLNYIKVDSPKYIYKVTEKSTGKSYVGKTRNAPFFRWWNHLTHSSSPFGIYLRSTSLCEWTFEVLEILPYNTVDSEILRIESDYILKFNCIDNGYNSVISQKKTKELQESQTLFDNI